MVIEEYVSSIISMSNFEKGENIINTSIDLIIDIVHNVGVICNIKVF